MLSGAGQEGDGISRSVTVNKRVGFTTQRLPMFKHKIHQLDSIELVKLVSKLAFEKCWGSSRFSALIKTLHGGASLPRGGALAACLSFQIVRGFAFGLSWSDVIVITIKSGGALRIALVWFVLRIDIRVKLEFGI